MKKILIQLDTDPHPSAFDAIAAYDADVDVVIPYGQITAENLADVVQGAIFPRGPDGLANTAFWVGGLRSCSSSRSSRRSCSTRTGRTRRRRPP